jgi:endonuclease/exonuclease/phosphatase family metal-dependent hydrolase
MVRQLAIFCALLATALVSCETPQEAAPAASGPNPERLRVMTYNVMCSFCTFQDHPEWVHAWESRLPWLRDVITRHEPDLIGLQELQALTVPAGEPSEIEQLTLPQDLYGAVWYRKQPQDPIQADYPDAAVLYRKDRFTKLDEGFFWLGPTPDQGYGAGFANKATFPRLVAWALLHDTAGARDLYVASTHFDNNSPNQELSAPLVLERLGPLAAQHPVVFVGDFNSKPDSLAYAILATGKGAQPGQPGQGFHFQNAFDLATKWAAVTNGDQPATYDPQQRIDHFWLAGAPFQVAAWTVDLWTYGTPAQAPSDHDAMVTDLVWPLP